MRADTMQEPDEESRSKLSQLGDTPPEEFRKQLHELADWIADFREKIEQLRVATDDKPGAIRARLPKQAHEEGETFEKILPVAGHFIFQSLVHRRRPLFILS